MAASEGAAAPAAHPRAAAAPQPLPRILFITHRFPMPPDKGDRIRSHHILRFLAPRCRLHLASLADEPVPAEHFSEIQRCCADVAVFPLGAARWVRSAVSLLRGRTASEGAFECPGLRRQIAAWCRQEPFDAALVSASSLAPYLRLPELAPARRVVDVVDVDSEKWLQYAARSRFPQSWLYGLEGRRLRRLECRLTREVDGIVLVSEAEAALFRSFAPPGPVHAVVNGVDTEYFQPQPGPTDQACVFVGALDYRPNVEAALFFAEQVWPRLRAEFPHARFDLVGRRPAGEILALSAVPGVRVVGQVPDVRPYQARASVVVAPLQIARGIQNKVLEALAMAKPVVGSSGALTGLRLEIGRDALQADAPEEWAACVRRLWNDETLRQSLGGRGREYVERHHSWSGCLEPFSKLLGLEGDRCRTAG